MSPMMSHEPNVDMQELDDFSGIHLHGTNDLNRDSFMKEVGPDELVGYHGVQYAQASNADREVGNEDSHNLEQNLLEL